MAPADLNPRRRPLGRRPAGGEWGAEQAGSGDLFGYLQSLWRRKWVVLACVALLASAAYLVSDAQKRVYEAGAVLQIEAQPVDTSLFSVEPVPPERSLAAAARLVETTGVATAAARRLANPAKPKDLLDDVTASMDEESGFLEVTAQARGPNRAADVANAFASAVVATRANFARRRIQRAVTELERNIERLPRQDVTGRRQLSQQLQRLRALYAAQSGNAEIVEPAVPSAQPVSPRPVRNAVLAGVIGLLLGLALALLLERANRRVREPSDLEDVIGAPLLGTVPESAFKRSSRPEVSEAFRTLQASLTYFNVDQRLSTVLITSPMKADGKTTLALNLALAYANANKEVILVDADLRNPQIAPRVGLSSARGLSGLLAGEATLDDVAQLIEGYDDRFVVIPGGPPPPNPAALLASGRMRILLEQLADHAEIVIVDTPPILVVSDAIPLIEKVSGVVAVGRIGQTTIDALERTRSVVDAAKGNMLGVVATGTKSGGLYGYGSYGDYGATPVMQTPNGGGPNRRPLRRLVRR